MKKYYCLLLFLTLLVIASYGQLPGYGYFKTITIQSSQVNGGVAHVDFPVLISHTDPDLRSILNGGNVENSNGFDIRFTASDGITLLDHQLEDYDSTSGSITIWVRIPSLSTSANTDIIMHYGNSSISVDSSVPTVWDTNYKGVWHLNNDEFDGTSNTNNLVSTGTVNTPLAEIAGGQSFSFNEKLNGGIQPELRILGDVTVESWVNFNTLQTGAGDNSIIGYGNPALANADNHSYKLNVLNTNQLRAFWEYGSGIGEGAVSTLAAPIVLGAWNHLAFSRNSTSRTITFYFNGAQLGAPVGYGNNPNGGANSEIFLGEGFPGFDLDGLLDECRVSDIERSADWMSTSYNSMSNTLGSFYTMSVQSASNGWSWMDASITNGKIQGYSIAVDSVNQSLYIAGSFDNETAFSTLNPGQINNGGGNGKLDGFLLKYDFNGTLQWVTNMGSTDDDEALGVCVGPSGNIYVTGYFKNAMRFFSASGPSVSGLGSGGGEDMFTACYNSSGGYIWSKSGTSSDNLAGHEIEANSNGLYVLGPYDKTASFGPFSTESTFNNKSANYLLKYDFAGNELWMVEMKSDGDDYDSGKLLNEYKLDLTTDQDSVYVIGEYRGTTIRFTDIGNNLLPAPQLNNADGNLNVFYGAYANDGTLGWMNQIESNDNGNLGMAIAVDCDGLYITGLLRDGAIFPNSTLTTGEHDNTFIAQVDKATGSDNWVISLGGAQHDDDIGNDIIADGYGNIIVVGQYESDPFHMPSANITGAAGAELFVTCFDNTGIFKWVQVSNGSNDDKGVSIANYGKDKIFVTGTYDQTVNLPPFSSVSGDNDNLLVAGLNTGNTGTIQACFTPCGPTITVCKNDTTVLAGPTCNYTLPDLTSSVVVNDGCGLGILSIKQNPTIGTVLSAGDHKIVITATDINNNIDTCSFKLTISADINPIIVNCGDLLLNETTIGDTNNANSFSCVSFNTPGEDRYYQITVPTGNYLLGVTISNVMDANDSILNTFWVGSGCPLGGACLSNDDYNIANQQFVSNGLNQILFNAVGPGTYYFVVDSEIDGIDSYDIEFSCIVSGVEFDESNCGLDTDSNGIYATVNASPILNVSTCQNNTFCHTIYTKNIFGGEWLDTVIFDLGPCYTNVTNITPDAPGPNGFYNGAGTWDATYNGPSNSILWSFNHSSPNIWGDGVGGVGYNCRQYTLCFDADIIAGCSDSNDLDIQIYIEDDAVNGATSNVAKGFDYGTSTGFSIINPPPTISCPSNITANNDPGNCSAQVIGIAPTASGDNCPNPIITYNLTGVTTGTGFNDASGTTFNVGVTTVQYMITDSGGIQDSCQFTVTVLDNENPIITCPGNIVLSTSSSSCDTILNGIAPIAPNDNCAIDSVSYVLTGATSGVGLNDASSTLFNQGVTTVTYTVTDSSGNTASCNFTVTVNDNVNPTIGCPANVNIACPGTVNAIAPVAPNDNCAIDSVNYVLTGATTGSGLNDASGTFFNQGVTTVTYTVTDSSGNTASCNFTVTVNDNVNPTMGCPANVNIACPGTVNAIAPIAPNDNCAIDSVNYVLTGATTGSGLNDASGTFFNQGVTTVTYTVTDSSGNTASCNFTVTVNDIINPTIGCPANVNIPCPGTVNAIAPVAPNDNCAIDSVNYVLTGATTGSGLNDASGTFFNQGVTNVTYTVTDSSGNTASCNFTVTVNDTINPTITCPGNIIVSTSVNSCDTLLNGIAPISTNDNCAIDSVNYVLTGATTGSGSTDASGETFNLGITNVKYYIYDISGNVDSCSFSVTVNDNVAPSITCPGNISLSTSVNSCDTILNGIAPISTNDNCSIDSVNYVLTGATTGIGSTDASGETFNLGVTNVKYYIYDLAGNVDSCRFTVTVIDSVAPTISCPGNISLSTPNNNCDILVTGIAPITPNDNCAIDSVSYVLSGTTIGNGLNDASGAVFNLGVTNVKYYIYDLAGNVDSCSFTVTVIDSVPPTIACPGNIILSTSINSCDTIINGIAPISTMDNCAIDSVNYVLTGVTTSSGSTDASGETFNLGLTNVKYYIYDLAGNVDSCSFTVTVIDSVPPSITCPGSISLATSVNSCDTVVNGIAPISTIDNCAIDSVNYVLTGVTTSSGSTDASGETFNVGLTNVKYYIYDLAGNVDSCSFNVNVIDSIAPSITCPGNITLSTSVNSCDTIVNGIAPTSTNDNCAIDSVNYALTGATIGFGTGDASGNSFNLGVTNVLYFVYDLSGNVDSCNFSITVIDSIPPVISCPNNISISNDSGFCSAVVNSIAPLIITDNCSIDSVGYKLNGATTGNGLNDASGLTYNIGITTVIYYIYDLAGNTDSCSFTVTVTDNENPIITCPGNIVICDTNVIVPTPTFGDNCMVNTVTNDFNGLSNASGIYPYGITTVNWTVTDTSGNMSTCPMTIEVEVPPFSDAGPDQKLVGVNTTSLDGSTPVNGIGSWLNVSGYGFIQSVNDPKSILEDLDPGINVFEWIVSYGTCLDSIDEVEIEYIPLKIPNGFSPNNDGDNDQLVITGIDLIENELVIFNRWGVELFSQYNYQNDWEGKSKDGKELPEDTYFYILKIPELEKEFSGYIVLKR